MDTPLGLKVPEAWILAPVRHVFEYVDERSTAGDERLLSVTKLRGVVPRDEITDRAARADTLVGYKRCREGDLIVNQMSVFDGLMGVTRWDGIVTYHYLVFRPRTRSDCRYFSYVLSSTLYQADFARRVRGLGDASQGNVRTPHIRIGDFLKTIVPVPSPAAQVAIADFLDRETVRIDALITAKRRLIELMEERVESSIFHAITGGLDPAVELAPSGLPWVVHVPRHWGTPTVSMNFDLQLGKMLNAEAAAGPDLYPYVRNTNVQWDRISLDDLAVMHFDEVDRARCELRPGDVLVCEGGEVGRAAIWAGEMADCFFQKAIHRVRPKNGANGRYLMYCLRAAAKRSVFAVQGNLSTIVHLTGEQLRVHRFPWPPPDEQSTIVRHLDRLMDRTTKMLDALSAQIDLLVEHRLALITAAVTGEIETPGVAA